MPNMRRVVHGGATLVPADIKKNVVVLEVEGEEKEENEEYREECTMSRCHFLEVPVVLVSLLGCLSQECLLHSLAPAEEERRKKGDEGV